MSLRRLDSMSHYETDSIFKKWSSAFAPSNPTIAAGAGRCGENALKISGINQIHRGITLHGSATPSKGYCGFAVKITQMIDRQDLFGVMYSTLPQFYSWVDATGAIHVQQGGVGGPISWPGVPQASSNPGVINLNGDHYVEFGWTINGATSDLIIRVDNTEVLSASGITLRYDNGVIVQPDLWTGISLRSVANGISYFSSLYVTDDYDDGGTPATNGFLGDLRVSYLRPTLDGLRQLMTVVGGGTHANAVDKNYSSELTTPYVEGGDVGDSDTNLYSDPVYTSGTCYGIQINILAARDTAGPRKIAPVIEQSGNFHLGTEVTPPVATPVYHSEAFDRNPETGLGWQYSEVAAGQYGEEVTE